MERKREAAGAAPVGGARPREERVTPVPLPSLVFIRRESRGAGAVGSSDIVGDAR